MNKDQQRAAFEAAYIGASSLRLEDIELEYDEAKNRYFDDQAQSTWEGWQAAIASPEVQALRWQPIDTAPKDGTTILVWFRQHGAMTVCWGDRDYSHTSEYAIWLVDDHKHGPYPVRGYSRGDDTHWMPLPAPPADAAMEKQK